MTFQRFLEIQGQIQQVTNKLRESNKSLCRNLKENPSVKGLSASNLPYYQLTGNLMKMQVERSRVQEWFESTITELKNLEFHELVSKVEKEKRSQELLNEVRKKEKNTSLAVKELEAELHKEYEEHEKETKLTNDKIKIMKEELLVSI